MPIRVLILLKLLRLNIPFQQLFRQLNFGRFFQFGRLFSQRCLFFLHYILFLFSLLLLILFLSHFLQFLGLLLSGGKLLGFNSFGN